MAQKAGSPQIWAKPTVGPPTTTVYVSGSGFDTFAPVDIYFDTTDLALVRTDSTGSFGIKSPKPRPTMGGFPIAVPKDALPGTHWITAVERNSINAAQMQFLTRTDWAQFHFSPDHKGLNSYENILNPATVVNLGLKWEYPGGSDPVVANGIVYTATTDGINALNASNGALLWKYQPGSGLDVVGAAVANSVVYVVFYDPDFWDDGLYALNANTGALLWYQSGFNSDTLPTVANGVVYVGNYRIVFALNANTGAVLWTYWTGDWVWSSPAVAKGVVYVGSADKNVYALNASTGELLWQYATGGVVASSPAVANGVVYVGSDDGNLYALNAGTGALLWKYTGANGTPAVANGVVYVGGLALDANSGALLWQNLAAGGTPAVADGVVYFRHLYAFDLTGSLPLDKLRPPERPDPALLIPDWSLQPSAVVTSTINNN